jgi:hypothetical protein
MFVRWPSLVNLPLVAVLLFVAALLPTLGMQDAKAGSQLHVAAQSMDLHDAFTHAHKSGKQTEGPQLVKCCSNSHCSTAQVALLTSSISDATFSKQINPPKNRKIDLPRIASLILKPPRSSHAL